MSKVCSSYTLLNDVATIAICLYFFFLYESIKSSSHQKYYLGLNILIILSPAKILMYTLTYSWVTKGWQPQERNWNQLCYKQNAKWFHIFLIILISESLYKSTGVHYVSSIFSVKFDQWCFLKNKIIFGPRVHES